jgi:outer membrane protein OmpA-like peptidoglycan-associated protein
MRARAATLHKPATGVSVMRAPGRLLQRKCAACSREDERRQRSSPPDAARSPDVDASAGLVQLTSPLGFELGHVSITRPSEPRLPVQKKTAIGEPGDRFEQEADRIAEHVLRMSEPIVPRAPLAASRIGTVEQPARGERTRSEEAEPELAPEPVRGHMSSVFASPPPPPPDDLGLPAGGGRPLPTALRRHFEPRFGFDLGRVRIHDDAASARLARTLSARAFTLGADIYFGASSYAPEAPGGRQLLAHELTHVLQQGQGAPPARHDEDAAATTPSLLPSSAPHAIQRLCGPTAVGVQDGCTAVSSEPAGDRFLFVVDCDEFQPGEETRLAALGAALGEDDRIAIHGFASVDGPADFNDNLSCLRAKTAQTVLLGAGVRPDQIAAVYKHGATPGPERERRSVVVERLAPYQRCECVEELRIRSSGAVEGAYGISQYWTTVTPYWGADNTLGNFDTAGSGGWRWYGHKFQVVGRFSTRRTLGAPGRATFQQMARLTTTEGGTPGAWFDDMNYTDAGGGVHHWDPNAEAGTTGASGFTGVGRTIATDKHAYTDPPAVGYQPRTTNSYRNLEFRIYFRSAPGCGCPTRELSVTAAQEIRVTAGVPRTLRFP